MARPDRRRGLLDALRGRDRAPHRHDEGLGEATARRSLTLLGLLLSGALLFTPSAVGEHLGGVGAVFERPPDRDGWYTAPVKVTFVAPPEYACTPPETTYAGPDSASAEVSTTCSDTTGVSPELSDTFTFKYDAGPPTAKLVSRNPNANANGWNRSSVTVTWRCSDAASGAVSEEVSDTVATEGTNQSAEAACVDAVGNSRSVEENGINIDTTAPTASLAGRSVEPNADGWNRTRVTVTWHCSDSASGPVAESVGDTVSGEGAGQSAATSCLDKAGNATSVVEGGINIDRTAPEISGSRTPAADADGWTNSDVTVSFTCADDLSGVSSCTEPVPVTSEGANQRVTGTAIDRAGNTASATVGGINIDKTGPSFSRPGDASVEANGPEGAVVAYAAPTATDSATPDALPVTCDPPAGSAFPIGTTLVTCSSTDSGGNTGKSSFHVVVRDTTPPVLTAPADVALTAPAEAGAPAAHPTIAAFLAAAGATDVADTAPVVTNDAPPVFGIGQTRVVFTATDRFGNASSKVSTVTVAAPAAPQTEPAAADRTPPRDVAALAVRAGSRFVALRWQRPLDADFSHVVITRSRRTSAETVVYHGAATNYRDRGLLNWVEYRYVVVSYDRAGNRSAGVARPAMPRAMMLLAPKNGARMARAPRLRWARFPKATYYNVQLFRGSRKVLSAWPRTTRLTLHARWVFNKRRFSLAPGQYRWYVWPGLGPRAAARYGPLLGEGRFTVASRR